MPTVRHSKAILVGQRTWIRRPRRSDATEFTALARRSRSLHQPWVAPPTTEATFLDWLASRKAPRQQPLVVCRRTDNAIVGNINISEIILGAFRGAFLGYWIGAPFQGQGYTTEGLHLVLRYAFGELRLHRLEANIQPGNAASLALVQRLGFRREGFSPRYLKIGGRWRDHERWAVMADLWKPANRQREQQE
jgi:ribosomal-protein-alanine N-acetyltransferase